MENTVLAMVASKRKSYSARRPGVCVGCGVNFDVGAEITWNRLKPGEYYHAECAGKISNAPPEPVEPAAIEPTWAKSAPKVNGAVDGANALESLARALSPLINVPVQKQGMDEAAVNALVEAAILKHVRLSLTVEIKNLDTGALNKWSST